MWVSPKLINFFEQNSDKSKDEVITLLMTRFNYKLSTARQRYVEYQNNKRGVNLKEVAFNFFKENPHAVEDYESKKYAESLGMAIRTYSVYKCQFRAIKEKEEQELKIKKQIENPPVEQLKYGNQYYKGRLRKKFYFNDSRL